MKVAGMRELRQRSAEIVGGGELVVVTRHGKISGIYVPLSDPGHLPDDLRLELLQALGESVERVLDRRGVTEAEVEEGFRAHRRGRR